VARLDYLVAVGDYKEQYAAKQALLHVILQSCTAQGIQYLITRMDASDLSGLHVLEQAGFITLDGLLTFARALTDYPFGEPHPGMHIRLATTADSEATADLARYAYVYDRFHSDPVIPPERANELHAVWGRNSCTGQAVDAVVLAEDGEDLLGFVTCKLQRDTKEHLGQMIGTIVLVATARKARGVGIGRAMTLAALDWFHRHGVGIVEVSTQFRNIPASRLYESCAFRLVGSSITLRKFLSNTPPPKGGGFG
jgi:GNAT superfamily N-acetyltransferase